MRVLVGLVAAALLLAGCSGSGDASSPSASPSAPASSASSSAVSSSPAPTRTGPLTTGPGVRPGEKPPVLDPVGYRHTPGGALAFAAYFIQAVDWSIATNDPTLLEPIVSKSCAACRRYIDGLRDLKAKGIHQRGGRLQILSGGLASGTYRITAEQTVKFKLVETPIVLLRPSVSPSTSSPGGTVDSIVFLSWMSGGWRIVGQAAP